MNGAALKYSWLTCRRDPLWFPLAFLALFIVLLLILPNPAGRFSIARAYLGFIVPLIGGILAAYGVLDDPALELRFSTPVRAGQTLLVPLGVVLAVQMVCALVFQLVAAALGIDLSPLGGLLRTQLVWFLPTLSLAALGCAGALAAAQTSMGAFLAGAAWLVQLLMNSGSSPGSSIRAAARCACRDTTSRRKPAGAAPRPCSAICRRSWACTPS